jgi:hypothetical protein
MSEGHGSNVMHADSASACTSEASLDFGTCEDRLQDKLPLLVFSRGKGFEGGGALNAICEAGVKQVKPNTTHYCIRVAGK